MTASLALDTLLLREKPDTARLAEGDEKFSTSFHFIIPTSSGGKHHYVSLLLFASEWQDVATFFSWSIAGEKKTSMARGIEL